MPSDRPNKRLTSFLDDECFTFNACLSFWKQGALFMITRSAPLGEFVIINKEFLKKAYT